MSRSGDTGLNTIPGISVEAARHLDRRKLLGSLLVGAAVGIGHGGQAKGMGKIQSMDAPKATDSGYDMRSMETYWVDVRDYGAIGDGFADDSEAFQNALNAASELTIRSPSYAVTLYIPPGLYLITSPLTTYAGVCIMGDGWYAANILADFNGNVFTGAEKRASEGHPEIQYTTFRGFSIRRSEGVTGYGFSFSHGSSYNIFEQIMIRGGSIAVHFEDLGYSIENRFSDCVFSTQSQQNVFIGQGSNATQFTTCVFLGSPIGCFLSGTSVGIGFVGCTFEGFTNAAIVLSNSKAVSVSGGYLECPNESAVTVKWVTDAGGNLGSGNVNLTDAYINAKGGQFLADVSSASSKEFRLAFKNCTVTNLQNGTNTSFPANVGSQPGAPLRSRILFQDNTPFSCVEPSIVRGSIGFEFALGPSQIYLASHKLGVSPEKLSFRLYAYPTEGDMSGKEIEVGIGVGNGRKGYAVWWDDENTVKVAVGANGGMIYDPVTGTFTNTGVSTTHRLRLIITLAGALPSFS